MLFPHRANTEFGKLINTFLYIWFFFRGKTELVLLVLYFWCNLNKKNKCLFLSHFKLTLNFKQSTNIKELIYFNFFYLAKFFQIKFSIYAFSIIILKTFKYIFELNMKIEYTYLMEFNSNNLKLAFISNLLKTYAIFPYLFVLFV